MIQKRTLAEEVAAHIRQQISLGFFKTNDKLPIEHELAKKLQVGRSTVREAIKLLANSGIIRVQHGIGSFVNDLTLVEKPVEQSIRHAKFEDLKEIRNWLDVKAAQSAAVHRTEEDLLQLQQNLRDRLLYAEEGNTEKAILADVQFHKSIAQMSKNTVLADLYQVISDYITQYFHQIFPDTQVLYDTHPLHASLYQMIVEQNAEAAGKIVEEIITY